jgi:uncharacterized protein YfaS (alpha-2-macroglobulin family)
MLTLMFCLKTVKAQVKYDGMLFRIDSLANVGLPKSALKLVDTLDTLARKNNNTPLQIRAAIYRMTFQSYLEEDALVTIINRLKTDIDRAAYPVKPVLQSLLAQMYWNYYQQNRWRFNQRTKLEHPDADFTNWDTQTVINETSRLYELSLRDAVKEQNTPITALYGVLQGDSTTRYLRPTLYDLLVQRAFDFFLSDEAGITKPKLPFRLNDPRFFGDSRTFAGLEIKTTDTASTEYKGIKYLQLATAFHLMQKNEEALADLDMQRLKFLHSRYEADHKDSLYISALKQIAGSFSTKPISAEALVMEGQYYQGLDSLTIAYSFFKKAVDAWPKSLGGKNAAILIKQVEEKELSATVEDVNVPGKAILGLIGYRNVREARVSIYRLTTEQLKRLRDSDAWLEGDSSVPNAEASKLIKQLVPVQESQLLLPDPHDLRKHNAEFEVNALTPGTYVMIVNEAGPKNNGTLRSTSFTVTHLAYSSRINPDRKTELSITDRENGAPLAGVNVSIYYRIYATGKRVTQIVSKGVSDENGRYIFKASSELYKTVLTKGTDSFSDQEKYFSGFLDNTTGVAQPETSVVLFTDRQIYRPGQTIYFKALRLTTLDGKSDVVPDTYFKINFYDANSKIINSLDVKTNDLGSAQGSFIIPQTTLNGQLTLRTAYGSINVRVEEYKRPTFQVEFSPVKQKFHLNDSVKIQGKVITFSGYGISGAKVAVHVTAQAFPVYESMVENKNVGSLWVNFQQQDEIKTDTIRADDSGNFSLSFKFNGEIKDLHGGYVLYSINADVTDASGETQSANKTIKVSDHPLSLTAPIPSRSLPRTDTDIPIKISDINGQPQKGMANIKIYALKGVDQVFKTRLWPAPDQFILNEQEFKNTFPGYSWKSEDNVAKWDTYGKVYEENINISDSAYNKLNLSILKSQPSGIYKIVLKARDDNGDTTSTTQVVNVFSNPSTAKKMEDWVVPVLTKVNPGENAEFLLGINKPANVLVEQYDGTKLLSAEWLKLTGGNQRKISIPVKASIKNSFSVQFLMINDNRLYNFYQRITVMDTAKKLNIRFLTFRDKLQPGEKEQWKLEVKATDNRMLPAEMLADLYDASLDDIAPAQYWRTAFDYEPYNPDYYEWMNSNFVKPDETSTYEPNNDDYNLIERNYEQLYLFGYDYYGGENSNYHDYVQTVDEQKTSAKSDKAIAERYVKNTALVKKGYDVIGRVISNFGGSEVSSVKISIANTGFYTFSNSSGYFRVKVPYGGSLVFMYKGYYTKKIKIRSAGNLIVTLNDKRFGLHATGIADPGVKSLKGDKNVDVTIDEPVGTPDQKVTEDDANAVAASRFPAPVVKPDNEVSGYKFVLREIPIKLGQKFNKDLLIRTSGQFVHLRTNFAETAFFYPQLQTNEKGEILIDFTIPEALTKWKFRGFAHTRDLQTGYIEREVITQKQLSISANTPRFLREGDTITISARLANLTAGTLKGRVEMKLFNALNMQPVSILMDKADAEQPFEIAGGTNKAVAFRLIIPSGLDALTYRLTADAGEFTDGEENTLPVLPNRMLVTESMPMMVRAGQTRAFTFDKLVHQNSSTLKNKTLTLEYTQNPAWYAVQALPYMMEFPYECSEQVFSRYYANSLATSIFNKMPAIKQVFDQWKAGNSSELLSNLEKNPDLKLTLLEETPWLNDAISESEQKKRIALLFDLNKMSDELKLNLYKLQKRQLPDGGFTWFGGDRADRYITQHIAEGMGELFHLGIADKESALKPLADNAIRYLDDQLVADENYRIKNKLEKYYSDLEIHAWYTRSFFLDIPLTKNLQKMLADYLTWAEDKWVSRNVYEQGLIALTMQRYKKPEITAQIERSLLETAQQSDDLGMYWAANQQGYFWYQSPVETQSLLIGLFTEAGDNAKAVDEMKIWLLRNKQTNNWKTTKATAAACYALLLKGTDLLADTGKSTIKIDGKPLEQLKPDVKADAGTGYLKTTWADEQIKPALGKVEISNSGKNISWGALHWQYLENVDKITSAQTNIHLERNYFIQKQTDAGPVLTAVDPAHLPKTGDLLKVVVYLKADRDFEYVQLKDMRPAGTEPVDALSAYKYQDGLYYYQVTKDVATNFFISYLNKGNYVFEYQLRVAQPGNFSTGITSIQCMYAPEFNAHSQGGRITVIP